MFQSQTRSQPPCDGARETSSISAWRSFNLRREASPHATTRGRPSCASRLMFQSQTRSQPPCDAKICAPHAEHIFVSISDEKPAPMRRSPGIPPNTRITGFNLRREASPHATRLRDLHRDRALRGFQSQTRSQPPCDSGGISFSDPLSVVSISDEKPAPMRLHPFNPGINSNICFNLRREASPHATKQRAVNDRLIESFNLRREASPHATRAQAHP